MKPFKSLLVIVSLFISSCSPKVSTPVVPLPLPVVLPGQELYSTVTKTETYIYDTDDTLLTKRTIPPGKTLILGKEENGFIEVNYGGETGFILSRPFPAKNIYSSIFFVRPPKKPYYLVWKKQRDDEQNALRASKRSWDSINAHAISAPPSGSGRVQVSGYYRKNGTYVQPYTRSAPTKRK